MHPKAFATSVPWRRDDFDVRALDWPVNVDVATAVAPITVGIGVLLQRSALFSPGIETLLVLIALSPWLLNLAGIRLPLWVCTLIVGSSLFALVNISFNAEDVEDISPFLSIMLVMEVAAIGSLRQSLFTLGFMLLTTVASVALVHDKAMTGGWLHALPWYIGIVGGWCGGVTLQAQLRAMEKLKAAQADLARKAAANERQRIAHEIHDVIAHSLTVTMLHITGARKALERSSAEAAEALQEAERLGRQSLADIRQVVGVLKTKGENDAAALPDATDIETLVQEVKAAGADVDLDTRGDVAAVAPTTGLALYRIVQESLTNVAKHAPGKPARVDLHVDNGTVSLRVSNPLPERTLGTDSLADSLGLWGMKERVQVLGGEFSAGPRDGHWVVDVTAPTAPTVSS